MYSTSALNDKVLKEYERYKEERENKRRMHITELYITCPELKVVDDKISKLAITNAARIISEGITPEEAVEAVNSEKEVLLKQRDEILKNIGYNEPEPDYHCELCKDTGVYNNKKCKCYMNMMKKFVVLNGDSNSICFDFENDNFDNFSMKWFSKENDLRFKTSPYDNMTTVYRDCVSFCNDFETKRQNLYFYGNSGTGKTFMASCIANDLISKGYTVVYQSAYKLFQFMEDYKFGKIDRTQNTAFFDSIYNAELLIIDDLGTEFGTAYTCSVLFDILNSRIMNEKSTIISSNLTLNSIEKKYTDRVYSRIVGNFEIFRFIGEDIRIAKRTKRG